MKTISLKPSKKTNTQTRRIVAVVFVICIIIAAVQFLFPNILFRTIYFISTPFTTARDAAYNEFSSIGAFFSSKASLSAKNAELEKDIEIVSAKLLSMEAIETENSALQNMISAKQTSSWIPKNMAIAEVVERPPFSPYDTLILSSGETSGISTGNPIFADDGTPIGTIESVFPNSAKGILFSNPGQEIRVIIGQKKFETMAEGDGEGNFETKIPVGDAPSVGDAVYIPEFAPTAIGIVKNVSAAPTDTFAKVLFSFPENILQISFVAIDTTRHFQISINPNEATTTGK